MRLLVLTQAVDTGDPVLGFFHGWLTEFSEHFEHISVICLKEGKHALPRNVRIHSLGKERTGVRFQVSGVRKIQYVIRFYSLAWHLRHEYDAVLVHMNQEYVLFGGKLWWLLRKPVYLWRNHYKGGVLTDIAAFWCRKVFCTSKYSYTAKYRKTVLMPVGIDTNVFKPLNIERKRNSILSLGRIAPSKHIEILIKALGILKEKGLEVEADIVGDPLPQDVGYQDVLATRVKELNLNIRFHSGVPNTKTPELYSSHDIFVNCSQSGMYDKTLYEAAACGALVVASSDDFRQEAGEHLWFSGEPAELVERLEVLVNMSDEEKSAARDKLASLAQKHSLEALGKRLAEAIR